MRTTARVAALAIVCACADPGSPGPTSATRWRVSNFALGVGALSPTTFDIVVTQVGIDSFRVNMPAITWSIGPVVFDSTVGLIRFVDTTNYGFFRLASNPTEYCQFFDVWGRMNAGRDTLKSATVQVVSGDTTAGGFCAVNTSGPATVTKQP